MSHAAVYIRRAGSGSVIVGARLVHARGELQWHPPTLSSGGSAGPDAPQIQSAIKACAQWIVKSLATVPGEPQWSLCLDMDGSRCSWFSAPSADEQLVTAAIGAAQLAGESAEGQGSLAWLGRHEVGTDLSVQPLAAPPMRGAGGKGKKDRKRAGDAGSCRVAVLASADLGVRLLLDELDAMSATPARVVSLLHLLGEGWQERKPGGDAECVATIVIDPRGQLLWSWNGGPGGTALLCGGTIRLRTTALNVDPSDADSESSMSNALSREAAGGPDGAVNAGAGGVGTEPSVIEISRGDVGRLVAEWLSWSTQLGVAPRRVLCAGPSNLVCVGLDDDLPNAPGIGAMGQTIGRAWPGTVVAAKVEDDPILATLRQSVIACNDLGLPGARPQGAANAKAKNNGESEPVDGRLGLLELSRRPGRSSRRVYAWNFVMLVGAAVLIAAVGYKLQAAAGSLDEQRIARANATAELLLTVRDVAPGTATDPDPAAILRRSLKEMEDTQKKIVRERPVLSEFTRVMRAFSSITDRTMELRSIAVGTNEGGLMSVHMPDADTSTILNQRLSEQNATGPWLNWSGGATRPTRPTEGSSAAFSFTIAAVWVETPKPKAASATPAVKAKPPANATPNATPAPEPKNESPAATSPAPEPTQPPTQPPTEPPTTTPAPSTPPSPVMPPATNPSDTPPARPPEPAPQPTEPPTGTPTIRDLEARDAGREVRS